MPPSARCSSPSPRRSTASRAAPTWARTARVTSSRWSTTASSTPTCSSSPRPTTCSAAAGLDGRRDRRRLPRVEHRRPRLLPHRDHRRGARARSTPAPARPLVDVIVDAGRAEGHRPLDGADRPRARRARVDASPSRSSPGPRPVDTACARPRPRRAHRAGAAGPVDDGTGSSTTSVTRCGRPRSSPTPRAWSRSAQASETYGWDVDIADGGPDLARRLHHPRAAAGADQRRVQRRRRCPPCSSPRASPRGSPSRRTPGVASSPAGDRAACPCPGFSRALAYYDTVRGRAAAGRARPGAARQLRRAHLPARRPPGAFHTAGRATAASPAAEP